MQFEFTPATQGLLSSVISVTACMGYRAQDLRITAAKGELVSETAPTSRFNGTLHFEFAGQQSHAEFKINAVVEEEGVMVTNSYFLNQLPPIEDGVWKCSLNVMNQRLKTVSSDGQFTFDFACGEASTFLYEPTYCDPNIDLGAIANKLNSLSRTISGFVNRKSGSDMTEIGCVKLCGTPNERDPANPTRDLGGLITFEATNMTDAIYGEEPVANMGTAWQVLIPIALFASWSSLPLDTHAMTIGIDANYQITLRCGPITIQHSTLSNLISRMEDVSGFAGLYKALGDATAPEHADLAFEMSYVPSNLLYRVQNATIYADGDPSLHITSTDNKSLNIEVRAINSDSNVRVSTALNVVKTGELRISKGSLALVSRIQDLAEAKPEESKPETWLNVRADSAAIMVASADKRWLAIAGQTTI